MTEPAYVTAAREQLKAAQIAALRTGTSREVMNAMRAVTAALLRWNQEVRASQGAER